MADFIDKKEKLADLLEEYKNNSEQKQELIYYVKELENDSDFKNKDLFTSLFKDINNFLGELSSKEIKQRILLIRSFIE